ncbi:MAG: protein kinase [Eubacterium sp.]|nr:protein kinase [Eubacterium sp.]
MRFLYCPNCFRAGYDGMRCPSCNYENKDADGHFSLAPGIQLKKRYWIGRVLGKGGFGITYLALDGRSHQRCAVKEYFPAEFSVRGRDDVSVTAVTLSQEEAYQHGIEKFMEEARCLRNMSNIKSIVNIWDYFKENGTAYFVMDFLDGCTLKQEFKANGNRIPYEKATAVLISAIKTLMYVHEKGIIHRDISPENIFLTKDGQVVLIDFGAAREYLQKERNAKGEFSVLIKHGFAPPEQYYTTGNQGTWTDVYALAATYYYMVSGERVPQAMERMRKGSRMAELSSICQAPPKVSGVIRKALEVDLKKRIPNMEQFYNEMRKAIMKGGGKVPSLREARAVQGYLSRIDAGRRRERWLLPPYQPMLMGRTLSDKCDIIIDRTDRNVSREHCYVTYLPDANAFQVYDNSEHGTYGPQGRMEKHKNVLFPAGTMFYAVSKKYQFLLEVE